MTGVQTCALPISRIIDPISSRPSPRLAFALNSGPFPPPALHQPHRSYGPVRHPQQPGHTLAGLRLSALPPTTEDFPCRALPLHTRAAVTIPADWPVAFIARFPSHTSLPPSSYRVGIRGSVFGTCSTFTTRCSPRVRRITHGDPLLRRLRSLRYLHDRSNGYRLERQLPGGSTPHWESARFHGARNFRLDAWGNSFVT